MKISTFCASLAILLACTLSVSSCCSIVNGRSQEVNFKATPSGSKLFIDGQDKGTVPQTVTLKRSKIHTVRIEAPGYAPYETTVKQTLSGWAFGNIILGGLIGIAIDVSNGSIYALKDVDATLAPSIQLSTVRDKPEGARKIGTMKKSDATQSSGSKAKQSGEKDDTPVFVMPGSAS